MEKTIVLKTTGMHCASCEKLIEDSLKGLRGVRHAKSDYNTERTEVVYEEEETNPGAIKLAIETAGFKTCESIAQAENFEGGGTEPGSARARAGCGISFGTAALLLGAITILGALYLFLRGRISMDFSGISEGTGVLVLLGLGFLTGFHCIGMCGGFVLAYAGKIKKQGDLAPHLMYGAGKTLSYAFMGAISGLIGSVIAFTPELRGYIAVLAGAFLVLYGANTLNLLPFLRRFQLRLPSLMPPWEWGGKGPLVTGLLNGLMLACGPLQALYIFAAGTGSPVAGAKALLFFGLGTLGPMLAFGVMSRHLGAALANNFVRFSGVLVVLLGLLMAGNGLALLGVGLPDITTLTYGAVAGAAQTANETAIKVDSDGYQVIQMNVTSRGWEPDSFVLKSGVPVKWKINALELNGCNNEILVRDYGLDIKLRQGVQTVTFTPSKTGTVRWSCWMGMIQGQFIVAEGDSGVSGFQFPVSGTQDTERGTLNTGHACGCGG